MDSSEEIPAQSYYALLNLTPTTATPDHIKSAYKKLCLLYHPDKFTTQQEKDWADKHFRLLNTAYRVLSDETSR
jgi:DnaJ homolog subfamily C member 11